MRKIIGTDISFYQDDPNTPPGVDFTKMHDVADFVIIRAGQNLWADKKFKENWQNAKLAGIPRGSYWFYDSRVRPDQQAELWVNILGDDMGELPLFADLEETYDGKYKGWRNWKIFLEKIKLLARGKEIAIYTAYYYWRKYAPSPTLQRTELEYFHRYPLWIANYEVSEPRIPKPWQINEWLLWQYTSKGDGPAYGVESGNIDLNYFNGDALAFSKRFNVPMPPEPPPPPAPDLKTYIVTASALKLREGPGQDYNVIGYLKQNDIVEALDSNSDGTWLQVKRKSDGATGWSSAAYLLLVDSPPNGEPGGRRYRVTAASLYVRLGPASTYKPIGYLVKDDIVEELEANADNTWRQIRRVSDGLTGWASAQYMVPA